MRLLRILNNIMRKKRPGDRCALLEGYRARRMHNPYAARVNSPNSLALIGGMVFAKQNSI
jgi:hypothetical protein